MGAMKLFAVLLGALALVAGFTGGLRAYSTSAHQGSPVPTAHVSVRHYPPAQVVSPGPVVKWAPRTKPAVRIGRACVTRIIHTVTLPPPVVATPRAAAAPAAPASHTQAGNPHPTHTASGEHHDNGGDDNGGDNGGEDEGGGDD